MTIVVGYIPSPQGLAAVDAAIDEALRRDDRLVVVNSGVLGDYSVASDHVQVFGWAPASDTEAQTARSELLASGWKSIGDEYITENPSNVLNPDSDGYGMTYQFGDGWITLADTKQGLLLVERPGS